MNNFLKILNGSLLVAGTSIGGGMLALPVLCAKVGLLPSLLVMLGIWTFMTTTALMYLECSTWMHKDSHLISMATKLLGPWGKRVCWVFFAFICYASLTAYVSGGGRMVHEYLTDFYSWDLHPATSYFLYAGVFGALLFARTHTVGSINSIFFLLMLGFFIFMIQGAWNFDTELLLRQDWQVKGLAGLVPMMLTTFSFPGIVPVLASYHKGDTNKIRTSIISGTGLTLAIYAIWLFTVLGNVPWSGPNGLAEAFAMDKHACDSLVHFLEQPSLHIFAQGFAFLALTTSFLGIATGLHHFLSEGLNINKSKFTGQMALFLLIVVPVLWIKFQFERVFFSALDMSGGLGDGMLSGLIPALMLWRGRYVKGIKEGSYRFFGNKPVLFCVMSLSVIIITYEVVKLLIPFFLHS